ncbi:formylglycine-generating enzyme family protein [Bradyrhizobium sp. ORS 285]|uniref:formylglycine-generating enzyme family protein n=2 Tax=Bradyrhizobium sp. ORS 285 TaxID=115808 RepID=UPI001112494C|nr:formylglycine-generating enzyme family protein [Bradyrhizobium sp. ORS 285]
MMMRIDTLEPPRAPARDGHERPPATMTYPVPCGRCGRVVQVALSALRAPGFHDLSAQISCPDIQERRTKSDRGLLLMMCGPLQQSLAERCDRAEVELTAPSRGEARRVVCSIPGVSVAHYTPNEARSQADMWQAHGQARLAARLREAAASAERRSLIPIAVAAGVGALLLAAVGGSFMLLREPVASTATLPQTAEKSVSSSGPPRVAPPLRAAMEQAVSVAAAPPPAVSREAPSDAPTDNPPATQIPDVTLVAEAAPAQASPPAPDPEAKIRLPDVVMIPGGSFAMGGTESSEQPVHRVTIKPFALGKYPVTIGEWKECVADKACADVTSGPDDNPVTNVSYEDAGAYLAWLSRTVGKPFRLPTEAEWEYAARGGTTTKFWWGDQMRPGTANCSGCNDAGAAPQLMKVGYFQANPFGLFDMGGSVDQWVADSWHKNYQGAPSDGSAWMEEQSYVRVIRSGSWKKDASYARSGSRDRYDGRIRYPTHGFRVALSL